MIHKHISDQDAFPGAHRALQLGAVIEVFGEFDEEGDASGVVVNGIINWEEVQ